MQSKDRIVEEMARGDLQFKLLAEISQAIVSSANLDEVLRIIAARVAQATGSPICTIRFVEGNELSIGAAVGYKDDEARKHRITIDERLGRVVHDQQPLIVPDLWTAKDVPPRRRERAKREGVRGFLAVPAVYQGNTVAILSIYKKQPHRFTAQETEVMQSIAKQVAVPIENVRLYQQIKAQALQTEQVLSTTQERLAFLVSATPAVIFSCTVSAPYFTTFISENVRQVLGYGAWEFMEDPNFWVERIHPDDVGRVLGGRESLLIRGYIGDEYRFLHRDGTYRWMQNELRLVRNESRMPLEIVGYWVDITERKRAEEALRGSEAHYRTLFDGVPVGLYRTMPDGRFLAANRALAEMLGYPDVESLMGIDGRELFFDPQDLEKCIAALEKHSGYQNFELRLLRRDGKAIWVEDTSRSVRDNDGRTLYHEGSIRDITEHKQLEVLQEQMLETAKVVALGQMAMGVAHELNNPLGAALGYLQLAREDNLFREEAADYVARIEEQIQHAAKIVREVREFGVPPSPVLQVVDVNQLLKEAVELMQVRGLEPKISIIPTLDSGITPIRSDPAHLTQVFLNLLLNAQEAMPQGGKISIRSRRARDKIQITISDTGGGIAKEDLLRIFEPFFTTKPGKGMGMGLTVSYRIIQEHKGNIEVQSQKGKGTTFTVTLPVEKTGQSDQDHRISP